MVLNELFWSLLQYIPVQPPIIFYGPPVEPPITQVPPVEPYPMFMILFVGLIAWVILIRIVRIRSMLIIVGGAVVLISISLILEWVSNFIGISMIILCIIPLLLEHKEALLANVPSIKISQLEFKRRRH